MSEEKRQKLKEYQKIIVRLKKYQKNQQNFFFICIFYCHCIKMRKELIFNNGHNNYIINKYYFQKDKNPININEIDTKKIMLSNKTPHGEYGANKYYIAYLSGGFRPLHIVIKNIKLYTDRMNVLANDHELLKYTEIWNKIEDLFNKTLIKKGCIISLYIIMNT